MTVRTLFARKHRWSKGLYVRDNGCPQNKSYCLLGAISHVYGDDNRAWQRAKDRVSKALGELFGVSYDAIANWNDRPETTIEDVRRVCIRARV